MKIKLSILQQKKKKTVEKFDIYNMQCTNCGILDK